MNDDQNTDRIVKRLRVGTVRDMKIPYGRRAFNVHHMIIKQRHIGTVMKTVPMCRRPYGSRGFRLRSAHFLRQQLGCMRHRAIDTHELRSRFAALEAQG